MDPAYDWEVIEIPMTPPIVEGLISPLSVQAFPMFSPNLPATNFTGNTYFSPDARENLRLTHEMLARSLGPAEIADRYNTLQCAWSSGPASIRLIAWPPDAQRWPMGPNPAHKIEPRLPVACYLEIETGFKPAATAAEETWLDSFVAVSRFPVDGNLTAASPFELATPE